MLLRLGFLRKITSPVKCGEREQNGEGRSVSSELSSGQMKRCPTDVCLVHWRAFGRLDGESPCESHVVCIGRMFFDLELGKDGSTSSFFSNQGRSKRTPSSSADSSFIFERLCGLSPASHKTARGEHRRKHAEPDPFDASIFSLTCRREG